MRTLNIYWIGLLIMIIGASIIFISIVQMLTFEPKIGDYNQMVSEGSNGDIVYIYGEVENYGKTDQYDPENSTWYVELRSVEDIDFSDDNTYAFVYTGPKIYFYNDNYDWEFIGNGQEVIIKGKIIEIDDTKEVRGIDTHDGLYYERVGDYYNNLFFFITFSIGIIIGITGGLIAIFGFYKIRNELFPFIIKHKLQKREILGGLLIIIGIFLANGSLANIPYTSSYCALLGILFFLSLVCPGVVILLKEKVKRESFVNQNGSTRQKYKLKNHKIFTYAGTFLIILFFIISLVASTFREDYYIIFTSIIYYIVLIIFFYGLLIESRIYSPKIENAIIKLKSINKKPKVLSLITIILIPILIFTPIINMIIINEQESRNRIEYDEWNMDMYSEGDLIEIHSFLLGYKIENGNTYVIVQSVHPQGHSSYSDFEEGYYDTIIFDKDVSNDLPPEGEWLIIYGTIEEINPGSGTNSISIKGEKIGEEPYQYEIIPISILLMPALILLITFFYSYNFIRILKMYKATNTEDEHDGIQIMQIIKPPLTKY